MRITLFAFGTWGDVRPLVVLGVGLHHPDEVAGLVDPSHPEMFQRVPSIPSSKWSL